MSLNKFNTFFDNSLDAYVPELWANESLAVLEERMVSANLVYRDFEDEVANFGDTVNTRKPTRFEAKRKGTNDDIETQDAVATNIPVVLNQLAHVSFMIRDAEESMSFKNLVDEYIRPAAGAMAKFVDQVVLSQYAQFLANLVTGADGTITEDNVKNVLLDARGMMNDNLAPDDIVRNMIWSSTSETEALKTDLFLSAERVGDSGTALKKAVLGEKLGFMNYMSQNVATVRSSTVDNVAGDGEIDNASGYPVGTTTMVVSGFTAIATAGSWVTINGRPYRLVSQTDNGSATTGITIAGGLVKAVADEDPVVIGAPGAVNLIGGYAAGYVKKILLDSFTNFPGVGQMISFGTSATSAVYTIVQSDSSAGTVTLDRPLEVALTNDQAANAGPIGNWNFGFCREALALVCRPLASVPGGLGAKSATMSLNGVSMRVTFGYNMTKQGIQCTLDALFGVKVLDTDLGVVMLG